MSSAFLRSCYKFSIMMTIIFYLPANSDKNNNNNNNNNYDLEVAHPQGGSSSTLFLFLIELEFGNVGFWGEGKTEYLEKNPSEQGREPTTNSTHIWRRCWDLNLGHIGGRKRSHYCAIPLVPQDIKACCFLGICLYDCFIYRSNFIFWKCLETNTISALVAKQGIAKDIPSHGNQSKCTKIAIQWFGNYY